MVSRWWAVGLVVAAAHVYAHFQAGLTLPVPWPDELHFMLPARSLVERGSLFAPELHPERPLMWMPPGYPVVLAGVFTVADVSLSAARVASLVCVLGAFGLLVRLLRGLSHPAVTMAAAAAFLLHTNVVVAGNVARMEAALLLAIMAGAVLLRTHRPYAALAVLTAAMLLHPNAVYFLVGAAVYLVWFRRDLGRPTRLEWSLLAGVAMLWLLYGLHIARHYDGFVADMAFQLGRKAERNISAYFLDRRTAMMLVLAATAWVPRERQQSALLIAIAVPAALVHLVGHEMWYRPFDALFYALFAVQIVRTAAWLTRERKGRTWLGPVIAAAGLVGVLWSDLPRAPSAMRWAKMRTAGDATYVTPKQLTAVAKRIGAHGRARAEFFPRGDAALFLGSHEWALEIVDPVRHPAEPEVLVYHQSSFLPPHWQRRVERELAEAAAAGHAIEVVTERDDPERWVLVRAR